MIEFLWRVVAFIVSRQWVVNRLLSRAIKRPYTHIQNADGTDVYMYRYWLFNAYSEDEGIRAAGSDKDNRPYPRLPSIRIHIIMRPDRDRDPHNHPWHHARTIVLQRWYHELRLMRGTDLSQPIEYFRSHVRKRGDTATLNHDLYHRIARVPPEGVTTLFFTWKKAGSWGFLTRDGHVPWRKYLGKE